ncbi:hypothetical protein F4803DRAFT_212114 [Xylaria telfairii]|nr:hypothetical protein F4803DRAFT_212114 [Xylaria telfairii]
MVNNLGLASNNQNHPCLATEPTSPPTYSVVLHQYQYHSFALGDKPGCCCCWPRCVRRLFPRQRYLIHPSLLSGLAWMLGCVRGWMLGWLCSGFFDSAHLSARLFIHRSTHLLVHWSLSVGVYVCVHGGVIYLLKNEKTTHGAWIPGGSELSKAPNSGPGLNWLPRPRSTLTISHYSTFIICPGGQQLPSRPNNLNDPEQPNRQNRHPTLALVRSPCFGPRRCPILVGAAQPCATSLTDLPYCLRYSLLPCLVDPLVLVLVLVLALDPGLDRIG